MRYDTIAPEHQRDMLSSFWTMLQHLEVQAEASGSAPDRKAVEDWYRQWNRVTGDRKAPRWAEPERLAAAPSR